MSRCTLSLIFLVLVALGVLGGLSGVAAAQPSEEGINSAIEAIRDIDPTTQKELVWAVRVLMNMSEYDEANRYLAMLVELALEDEAMLALHEEYGSGIFFRMGRDARLDGEGRQLAFDILDAAHRAAHSPERLRELVVNLGDANPTVIYQAVVDLKYAGSASVAPLLEALANEQRDHLHESVRRTLIELGSAAIDPLIAALHSPSEEVQATAIGVLGRLDARHAMPYLIHPLLDEASSDRLRAAAESALVQLSGASPDATEAEIYLANRAKAHFEGTTPLTADDLGNTNRWYWDTQANKPARLLLDIRSASLLVAADLASDLYHLWPEEGRYRQLFLCTKLESEKMALGLGAPLAVGEGTSHDLAASFGVDIIEELLVYSMENDHIGAAIGAIDVLGNIGNQSLLISHQGNPRPLVAALRHRDRRIRFFACRAIMMIDPKGTYVGSSYLPEALAYFMGTSARRRVLIVHPRSSEAQSLVGMLDEIGYVADVAVTGRVAFERASEQPDYEFILVSDAIDSPPVRDLLAELRGDARTADIPVGLMARSDNLARFRQLAASDPRMEIFPRPHDVQGISFQSRRLLELADRRLVVEGERLGQALASIDWLERIAANRSSYQFYDIFRYEDEVLTALYVSELSIGAAKVLGHLATARAQQELVEFTSQAHRPIKQRRIAAEAFDLAVEVRGTLLTTSQIHRQYDRYNQSATQSEETQQVLGALLDTMESRAEE